MLTDSEKIWLHLLSLVLAGDAVMVIWFRGSIFALPRAYAQAWAESNDRWKWYLGELLSCPKCLPIHVAFWLFLAGSYLPHGDTILYVLAAGGLISRLYNNVWTA